MSEYKGIKGFQVQTRTEDPTPTEAQTGDFYYNSTTGQFKTINTGGAPIGSWSSGNALNTARYGSMSGGSITAAIAAAGYTPPNNQYNTLSESYNGTSWSEVAEINVARGFGASATQTPATAALIFGGSTGTPNTADTEYWNGSSWAEQADMNTARVYMAGAGSVYTAALAATGKNGGGKSEVESFNGSSWSEIAEVNTVRPEGAVGTGTNTATLVIGGTNPPGGHRAFVEEYNGSSWSEITDINTARSYLSSAGSVTDSLIGGGNAGPSAGNYKALTEAWDGTSWTEVSDMATARYGAATGTGTGGTNLLATGGDTPGPSVVGTTEEWAADDFQIKTVTTS